MALAGWSIVKSLVISSGGALSSIADISLPIILDFPELFADIGQQYLKIAIEVGDSGDQCYVEIIPAQWDYLNNKAVIWVRFPEISVSSVYRLYFDVTQPDNATYIGITGSLPAKTVWPTTIYAGVWHAQDPSGGTSSYHDSTANALHLTPQGAMTIEDLIDLPVGKGVQLDGVDDCLKLAGGSPLLENASISMVCAVYGNPVVGTQIAYRPQGAWADGRGYYLTAVGAKKGSADGSWESVGHGQTVLTNTLHVLSMSFNNAYLTARLDSLPPASVADSRAISYVNKTGSTEGKHFFIGADTDNFGVLYPAVNAIGSVLVLKSAQASGWFDTVSKSLHNQLFDIQLYIPSYTLFSALSQPYDILSYYLAAISDQPYGITQSLNELVLEQLYSMLLEIWNIQIYGDVPLITTSLTQPYRGANILTTSLLQRWGQALAIEANLDQPWQMPESLEPSCEQRYGIATAVLQATSEQLYTINELTGLFANLSQPYALAAEVAQLYLFDTKIFVDGERIPFISAEWQASDGDYMLSCDITVRDLATALKCVDGAEIAIVSAGDTYLLRCYDGWQLDKRYLQQTYRITGYSKTRELDLATPLLGDIPGGMASQLVADLAAPHAITVDWQMEDGYIRDGKLSANDETPLAVIKKIVHDAGGIVQSTLDGNLLIVAEEETAIPDYATVIPAATIEARLERISTSSQTDVQPGHNRIVVSDQLASGNTYNPEKIMIDSRTAELRLYRTPIDIDQEYVVTHRGSASVTIEPFGIVSREIVDELQEIKAGSGQTSYPIYDITARSWEKTNLGALNYAEDGLLQSEIADYSMVLLSYVTRYRRWICRGPNVETVQFVINEVQT